MTDKEQIIINGIDYTNALEDYLNDCIVDYCKSAHCDIEMAKDIILFPVAKQIEKLQQEKEKFKQECEQKDERIIEFTKEYQRLNEQKDKADKTISDLIGCVSLWEGFTEEESKLAKDSSIADLIMLLREKRRECDELEKKLRDLELKNTTLQNRYQQLDGAITECDRYRKALDEIEKEIRDFQCDNCEDYHCETCDMKDILDIINKAKGGNNENT